jgi:hypothetical protein
MEQQFLAPQSILELDEDKINLEPYDGDENDLTARRIYKLFQFWSSWNDLMKNLGKIEEMEKEELKCVLYSVIDRIGRILSATDIGMELIVNELKDSN